ncbi:hypothetical protein WMY93_029578 [Mugilogobius chulae]|uniref:Reverse transcriptase domain-containing protein n=1 Tax=Mugilogobius chulae TaxID=88201 RepID=A0AAW0MPF4_9GOBI
MAVGPGVCAVLAGPAGGGLLHFGRPDRLPRPGLRCRQAGPLKDSADLSDPVRGFRGAGLCVSVPSVFIVMRFCLAAASAGVYLTLYIARLELCEPSLRLVVTMVAGLMTVCGELLLLAVALGCQSWRGLLGAGAAPLTLFLSYGIPGVFPESPRWLLLSERSADMNSFSERRNSNREVRDDESFTELDSEPPLSTRPHLSFPELVHSRNIWKNLCVLGFTSLVTSPGSASPGPHTGARPGVGARRRAPGGRVLAHGTRPGPARKGNVEPPSRRPTTRRKDHRGRVQCVLGGGRGEVPGRPRPCARSLALGTWNVTSLAGKEPELVREVERFRLDIVGLTSTHSLGSGTITLERGWTLHFSGVAHVDRYLQAKRTAARAVAEAKTRDWERFGEAMEEDYRSASKKFWQTVRRLRRGKQCFTNTVYSAGGGLLTSTGDVVGRWKEYFEGHLNPTATSSDEEAETEDSGGGSPITQAEVTEVVNKLLSGKAPGVDEIRPEYLKSLDVAGLSWLTRLCNIAWRTGTVPLEWQTGVVVPLFKKGDRRVCSNYRGITLLSLPGKVYSRVLERRLRPVVEPRIQEEQCGFRPGRGTLDQLYTFHRVLEGSWEFAQPVHMCFVDLEKAFDRVLVVSCGECSESMGSGALCSGQSGPCTTGAGAVFALPANF